MQNLYSCWWKVIRVNKLRVAAQWMKRQSAYSAQRRHKSNGCVGRVYTRQSPPIFPFAIQSAATQPKRIGKVCLYVACGQDRGTATLISSLTAERASSQFNVTRRQSAAGCRLQPLHQSTARHSTPLGIVND